MNDRHYLRGTHPFEPIPEFPLRFAHVQPALAATFSRGNPPSTCHVLRDKWDGDRRRFRRLAGAKKGRKGRRLVEGGAAPTGAGETAIVCATAAITNAVAAITGETVMRLPVRVL